MTRPKTNEQAAREKLIASDSSQDNKIEEPISTQSDQDRIRAACDLGVPKFLVNKWLNLKNSKSKFIQKSCQIDNAADVSEYSVSYHLS